MKCSLYGLNSTVISSSPALPEFRRPCSDSRLHQIVWNVVPSLLLAQTEEHEVVGRVRRRGVSSARMQCLKKYIFLFFIFIFFVFL